MLNIALKPLWITKSSVIFTIQSKLFHQNNEYNLSFSLISFEVQWSISICCNVLLWCHTEADFTMSMAQIHIIEADKYEVDDNVVVYFCFPLWVLHFLWDFLFFVVSSALFCFLTHEWSPFIRVNVSIVIQWWVIMPHIPFIERVWDPIVNSADRRVNMEWR